MFLILPVSSPPGFPSSPPGWPGSGVASPFGMGPGGLLGLSVTLSPSTFET